MPEQKKTYEAMFLLNAGAAEFESASEPVRNILDGAEAEVISIKAWEERKLAYPIRGCKRGLYVLSYFKADPLRIAEMEHECQLEERILRLLVLRKDRITEDQISAETPFSSSQRAAESRAASRSAAREAKAPAPAPAPASAKPNEPADESAAPAPAGEQPQPDRGEKPAEQAAGEGDTKAD